MKIDSPKRTLAKTLSWRFLSLVITFVVTLIITGSAQFAISISALDTVIKLVIYYYHERTWTHLKWGRHKKKKRKKKSSDCNSATAVESTVDSLK